MFASQKFIDLSRKFVCVRIDSYESQEHQDWVRRFLRGRFANTAFCVLAPNGRDWLTRSGRSPKSVFGAGEDEAVQDMLAIAKRFPVKFNQSQAVLQDFHSIAQALNVASADQRLLVLVVGRKEQVQRTGSVLGPVVHHKEHLGRFHVDVETGSDWEGVIEGATSAEGILFVKSSEFGVTGKVLKQLPLDASRSEIHAALTAANKIFVATTPKKDYQAHVSKGHRLGMEFESLIPYGEDRNADGKIDQRTRRSRR